MRRLLCERPGHSATTAHLCAAYPFIADGGPFCSNADKNPTLTIMALAWRTSDHILEEMQKGNL